MTTAVPDARRRTVVGEIEGAATSLAERYGADAPVLARDLVMSVLGVPRHWIVTHGREELAAAQAGAIARAVARAATGMPLAYAVGLAPFRSLELRVDERVLIPRPETEQLVDVALWLADAGGLAIDVGTGSGAIALALAQEGRFGRVIGTDVSAGALAVAMDNGRRLAEMGVFGAPGRPAPEFRLGSWLAPCADERATLIVSNPPYIALTEAAELPDSVRDWEPPVALFADDGGLAGIDAVAREASPILVPGGWLALEVDSRRAGRAAEAVRAVGTYGDVQVKPDFSGRARFVVARRLED